MTLPAVHRQHVVTRSLIKGFASPTGNQLTYLDFSRQGAPALRKGPGGLGVERDFVEFDSGSAEAVWQTAEQNLPRVVAAAAASAVIGDSALEDAVRDIIALHWARSATLKQVHLDSYKTVHDSVRVRWASRVAVLDEIVVRQTGKPATQDAREKLLDRLFEGPPEILDGSYFARRVAHFFDLAKTHFRKGEVVVGHVSSGLQVCIGDRPVLGDDDAVAGVTAKLAPLMKSSSFLMPLGPDVTAAVVMDEVAADIQLDSADVWMINEAQVRAAASIVMMRDDFPDIERLRNAR